MYNVLIHVQNRVKSGYSCKYLVKTFTCIWIRSISHLQTQNGWKTITTKHNVYISIKRTNFVWKKCAFHMSCPERRESSLYHLVSTLAELPDRFPLILHTIQKKNQQQTNKKTLRTRIPPNYTCNTWSRYEICWVIIYCPYLNWKKIILLLIIRFCLIVFITPRLSSM